MPFVSQQQMRFMYAMYPKIAKKMTKKMEKKMGKGAFKKLPKKMKSNDFCDDTNIEGLDPIR